MGMENLNTTYKQNNEIPTVNPFNSNIKIYQQSFFHKSYIKKENNLNNKGERVELVECPSDCLELQIESNERLEFLGDSILGSTVAGYLYERFPDENEGFMTRLRTKLVNGEMLGKLAKKIDLSGFMIISRHVEERCNGRDNLRILEDVFESFIGALYLDFNKK